MYERGERKPRHSLREEDQGVGYLEDEESLEDRMGYYGKGAHRRRLHSPRTRTRHDARTALIALNTHRIEEGLRRDAEGEGQRDRGQGRPSLARLQEQGQVRPMGVSGVSCVSLRG